MISLIFVRSTCLWSLWRWKVRWQSAGVPNVLSSVARFSGCSKEGVVTVCHSMERPRLVLQ